MSFDIDHSGLLGLETEGIDTISLADLTLWTLLRLALHLTLGDEQSLGIEA